MSSSSGFSVSKLLKLIYVHNPFYLISACLFVYGLKAFFRPDNMDFLFAAGSVAYIDPWWLMGSLCGVTLLMATTAYLIVRFGKVWEDARSLVLVLMLMFLAISVSFDEIIALVSFQDGRSSSAMGLMVFGGAFSIGLTEVLLRGLKIRFPLAYRLPFYGLLALFFAFPMWVCPQVSSATPEEARWRVALFPSIAGAISLMLIPAVRKGARHVSDNGTPWSWPMFPWSVFVFLAGAVLFRSYSLAISFDRADARAHFWDSSFGLYFLVPFVLAILVVLLEVAIVERLEALRDRILKTAPLLLVLAYPGLGPWSDHVTYARFANEFIERFGSPVYLTLCALLVFYAITWWRGLKQSELGVACCLGLLTFVGPQSFGMTAVQQTWHVWPFVVLGVMQFSLGLKRRRSASLFFGGLSLCIAAGLVLPETGLRDWTVFVTYHLIVLLAISIGLLNQDAFSNFLRAIVSWLWVLTGCYAIARVAAREPTVEIFAYATATGLMAVAAWWMCRESRFLVATTLNLGLGVWLGMQRAYQHSQQLPIPAGVKPLIWAVICFSVAVLISMFKGGLGARWIHCLIPAEAIPIEPSSNEVASVIDPIPDALCPDATDDDA